MSWITKLKDLIVTIAGVKPRAPRVAQETDLEGTLRTLDHWRARLSGFPRTIECTEMALLGTDEEGKIFKGPGRIEIESGTEMRFSVYANPVVDLDVAFRKFQRAQEHPYDALEHFRLIATDYRGVSWTGGYTQVRFFADHDRGWPLSGEIDAIHTRATGCWVSNRSSVELLLIGPVDLPMSELRRTKSYIGGREISSSAGPGQHTVKLLGTAITFSYNPADEALWITADTSHDLKHPFLENWLTEPLRVLLGVPVYPRMVARNRGDGTADVWLRPSPERGRASPVGLLPNFRQVRGGADAFWQLYADILRFIAKAGSFESNEITRVYEELAQSQLGSRWVLTLTLASTAEALATGLMTPADQKSEFPDEVLVSLRDHITKWNEHPALRQRMLSNIGLVSKRSVVAFMRELGRAGTLNPQHVATWYEIRNSVMHGSMVEPWSSQEGDDRLGQMLGLVHDLTRARIAIGH